MLGIPCLDKCIIKRHNIRLEEAAKEILSKMDIMLRRDACIHKSLLQISESPFYHTSD